MQAGNAKAEVSVFGLLESRVLDHRQKMVLIREFSNRFNKILITVAITGYHFSHGWYHGLGIFVIGPLQCRIGQLDKFKHLQPATRAQHAERFAQRLFGPSDVADAK